MSDALTSDDFDADLARVLDDAGVQTNRSLIGRILRTGLLFGKDGTSRLDLKIASAALSEMRDAFGLFRPYVETPKVTVFGSARTLQDDPLYTQARDVAAALAAQGWMVVTGAGPGIMQAAAEGAGDAMVLGVSIRLPFEEKPDETLVADDAHVVQMKYFFTRKLMLMKESLGFVCLPGGFGTMDEMFELLTLQQTGKAEPMPIVLLDQPDGGFWAALTHFVDEQMVPAGVIAPDDLDRVLVTDSVDAAVAEITRFWRNYHSLRWVGDRLVVRLRAEPTDDDVAVLNEQFAGQLADGRIEKSGPLHVEQLDQDRLELHRLVLRLRPRAVGSLHRLIRAINALPTAP